MLAQMGVRMGAGVGSQEWFSGRRWRKVESYDGNAQLRKGHGMGGGKKKEGDY